MQMRVIFTFCVCEYESIVCVYLDVCECVWVSMGVCLCMRERVCECRVWEGNGHNALHGTPGSAYASSVGRRLGQRDYHGGRNPRREMRRSAQRRRTRINISPLARDTSRLFLWRHLRSCTWSLTVTSYSSYRSSTYHFSSTTCTHSPLPTPPHSRAHTDHPSVSTTSPPVTATSKLPNFMYTTYVT